MGAEGEGRTLSVARVGHRVGYAARRWSIKISIYIPKGLEGPLLAEAREAGESPSLFVQSLVRDRLEGKLRSFSDEFAALAGSWEDERSAEEIVKDIEKSRASASRPPLR